MRQVNKGPPIWLEDKHGYPLPEGETHVCAVWYMSGGIEVPAKLENVSRIEGLAQGFPGLCAELRAKALAGAEGGHTFIFSVGRHFLIFCVHMRAASPPAVQGG